MNWKNRRDMSRGGLFNYFRHAVPWHFTSQALSSKCNEPGKWNSLQQAGFLTALQKSIFNKLISRYVTNAAFFRLEFLDVSADWAEVVEDLFRLVKVL